MFMALYRAIAACIVLGIIIALAAVACAVVVIAVVGAIVYGLASRKQTVSSALHSLVLNGTAAVELISALRPRGQNNGSS
jgi:hypothetical protein